MQKLSVLLIALICVVAGYGQNEARGKVTVTITGSSGEALENATVELLFAKDSSLAKTAVSDKAGSAVLEAVRMGEYFIRASFVNHTSATSAVFSVSANNQEVVVPALQLMAAASTSEVVVTARKPFIQRLTDRLVVNVESSVISAGSSAMDVLEKAPGVAVDQNDAIGLRGRQGVIIMIDGKPTPLTGADLANYLRGLPSNAIERIDIITNPSAKYDAAGNSGIIDIRMKKDQRLGYNGTLTAGYGQGVYPKANAGTTFNYRNKKVNIFGNYNYSYREIFNHLVLDRNFYNNSKQYNGGDLKDNNLHSPSTFKTLRVGADYFPDKKNILGFIVSHNDGDFRSNGNNSAVVINDQHQDVSTFATKAENRNHNKNTVVNLNYKHLFNTNGKELTADVDLGEYNSLSLTSNRTNYFLMDGSQARPSYALDGNQDGKLKLRTGKVDYANPLQNGARFEAGLKTSHVSADNNAQFWDMSTGAPVNDVNKTNRFYYDEYNNAGYLNFSKEFKKFNLQLGLRGEHTRLKTYQVMGDAAFDSSYFQLFPSAYFNYKLKEDQTLGISVSRRIDRPGYSQLNPFLFLIDVTTYNTGNPWLLPQFTWSYELNYTLKGINFSLGYSRTTNNQNIAIVLFKDAFPNIPQSDNVTVQIPINLSTLDYYGLTVAAPVRVASFWNMVNNLNVYYNKYYGSIGITQLNRGRPALDYRINNTFNAKKGWVFELNGQYASSDQYGFMVTRPQWAVHAGVQKSVLRNKGTIRLNITDIFWTNLPKATITYDNYIEKWHATRETRVANLSFTYRFGKNTVQGARKRTTASEEERQRAGN